jgi:CRP-like cAMP-binding protein
MQTLRRSKKTVHFNTYEEARAICRTLAVNLKDNRLLAHLPRHELDTLRPHLDVITLDTREEINQLGTPIVHMIFPITVAISLTVMQESGTTVTAAIIGKEGCAGSYLLDGLNISPCRTIVHIGGIALRITVSQLRPLLPQIPVFRRSARRFSMVIFRHAVIAVGCSRFHSVEQRLARCLLAHWYLTGLTELPFTHDFLAEQLGAQRVTVTQALAALHGRGLVIHGYGKLVLLDIEEIKKSACECFTSGVEAIDDYLLDIAKTDKPL